MGVAGDNNSEEAGRGSVEAYMDGPTRNGFMDGWIGSLLFPI